MVNSVHVKAERFEALDPTCGPIKAADESRRSAARGSSLDDAVLAVVDNGFNPTFGRSLVEIMKARFRLSDVIYVLKDNVSVPPRPADWERIKARATAAIALYGG